MNRYLKFNFPNLDKIPETGQVFYSPTGLFRIYEEGVFFSIEKLSLPIQKNIGKKELPDLGFCIYCRRTHDKNGNKLKLTREHIIPDFLGSRLELPASSCFDCQKLTSDFERIMSENLFLAPIVQSGISGKNGVKLNKSLIADAGSENNDFFITSLAHHPTLVMLPLLFPAASYSTKQKSSKLVYRQAIFNLNATASNLEKYDIESFSSQSLDLLRFSQLVCKIALAYATHFHRDKLFTPLADKLVLTKFNSTDYPEYIFDNLGCLFNINNNFSDNLHELEIGEIDFNGVKLCVVRVQLFSIYRMPSYYVSVGHY